MSDSIIRQLDNLNNENNVDKQIYLTYLLGWHGDEIAQYYLYEINRKIEPILLKRGWKILVLKEFFPPNKNLLGLNVDNGQEVSIRLRYHHDNNQFIPFDEVMNTVLHEIAHCSISEHSAAFWSLHRDLVSDYENNEKS